jgi:hypothetical protein
MTIDDVAKKRELSGISWAYPTWREASEILQLFMEKRMMQIKYDDLLTGTTQTKIFYMSDPSAQAYRWSDGMKYYMSLGFNLIEQ